MQADSHPVEAVAQVIFCGAYIANFSFDFFELRRIEVDTGFIGQNAIIYGGSADRLLRCRPVKCRLRE